MQLILDGGAVLSAKLGMGLLAFVERLALSWSFFLLNQYYHRLDE